MSHLGILAVDPFLRSNRANIPNLGWHKSNKVTAIHSNIELIVVPRYIANQAYVAIYHRTIITLTVAIWHTTILLSTTFESAMLRTQHMVGQVGPHIVLVLSA